MSVFGENFLKELEEKETKSDSEIEVKEKKKKKKRKRKRLKKEEKHENVKKKKKTIAKEVSEINRSWINKNENKTVPKRKKIKSTSLMSFEENINSARKFTSEGIPIIHPDAEIKKPQIINAVDVIKNADEKSRSRVKSTKALTEEEKEELLKKERQEETQFFYRISDIINNVGGEKAEGSEKWKWKQRERKKLGLKPLKTKMPYTRLKNVNRKLRARGDMAKAVSREKKSERITIWIFL